MGGRSAPVRMLSNSGLLADSVLASAAAGALLLASQECVGQHGAYWQTNGIGTMTSSTGTGPRATNSAPVAPEAGAYSQITWEKPRMNNGALKRTRVTDHTWLM